MTAQALLGRKTWPEMPPIAVFDGGSEYFKAKLTQRLVRELFPQGLPEVRRFQGPRAETDAGELPLRAVLDELRTPSFFAPRRLVVVESADAFVAAHRDDLAPFAKSGFSVGHLLLVLDRDLDRRTRFAKALSERGWIVSCAEPYDRPPPWDTRTPPWESDLSRWLVELARSRGLEIDIETAFLLHERVGTDLGVLDEEVEKLATYLRQSGARRIDAESVRAVCGELRESTVFEVVDAFLERRRRDAFEAAERLFSRGYRVESGALVTDPSGIALPLLGFLLARLRSLRRAHALAAEGAGSDVWIQERLVQRAFIRRFERQLRATPPERIAVLLGRLFDADRRIKVGTDPRRLVSLLLVEG